MARKTAKAAAAATAATAQLDKPEFELQGRITEYHEIQGSERLSGQRIVLVCPMLNLKPCEDKSRKKRVKYGTLKLTIMQEDGVHTITSTGKLRVNDVYPEAQGSAGERVVSFQPGGLFKDDEVQAILQLRRRGQGDNPTMVGVAFAGSYDQKQIWPDDEAEETEDEEGDEKEE